MTLPIQLVPHQPVFTADWLGSLNLAGRVIACDFYVSGAESAERVAGGYDFGQVLNVDHHAPTTGMAKHVSSTNLALEPIGQVGREPDDSLVVISHTDCDSVLSSGIMSGQLDPDPAFGAAAIAADHTGEVNDLADLLQGLDDSWDRDKPRDPLYFINVVRGFMADGERSLDSAASAGLAIRRQKRREAAELVDRGQVPVIDGLGFGTLDTKLDGVVFPPLLRDAQLIVLMTRRSDDPSRWDAKYRLGQAAPAGSTLFQLGIEEFDPSFGARWNAGSSSRNLDPEAYRSEILKRLDRLGRKTKLT